MAFSRVFRCLFYICLCSCHQGLGLVVENVVHTTPPPKHVMKFTDKFATGLIPEIQPKGKLVNNQAQYRPDFGNINVAKPTDSATSGGKPLIHSQKPLVRHDFTPEMMPVEKKLSHQGLGPQKDLHASKQKQKFGKHALVHDVKSKHNVLPKSSPYDPAKNIQMPVTDTLVVTPLPVGSKTAGKSASFSKPLTQIDPVGVIPDALALLDMQHVTDKTVGFNDIFFQDQQTIHPIEPHPSSIPIDTPVHQRNKATWPNLSWKRAPEYPHVTVLHRQDHYGNGKFSYKNAVLLSYRPPAYFGSPQVQISNWVDLATFKTSADQLNNPFATRTQSTHGLFQDNTPRLKTLLESRSVKLFENQFDKKNFVQTRLPNQQYTKGSTSVEQDLLWDLDLNADPCDDFYQFACGGFVENTTRINGMTSKDIEAKGRVIETVTWVLEETLSASDPVALVKGKKYFQSCMNEDSIEMRGLSPLINFLSDRGGWPVLELWDPRRFNLVDILARTRSLLKDHSTHYLPTGTIIGMTVQRDFKRPGQHVIYLDQPSLGQFNLDGMPNNEVYMLGKDVVYNKAYEDYLVDIAVALGANADVARKDMCDVIKFETSLAEIMLPEEERRAVTKRYWQMSILEMSLRYPYFDWFHFIQKVMQAQGLDIHVKLSNKVVLWASPYFDRLNKVLSTTPKRVLANYVLFRAMQPMLPATSRLMQYITLRYTAVVNGAEIPKLPKRSDFCAEQVINNMDWLASRIYVESSFGKEDLAQVSVIKDQVKKAFTQLVESATWLDNQTKEAQLLKLETIRARIGFPSKLLNDKLLNAYYKNFNITENFFENTERVLKGNYAKLLQKLVVTPLDDWIVRPSELHAVYNGGANAIEIPAAFVQPPYYDMNFGPAMKFGGIGTVIARYYAHAFDISGMMFDNKGALRSQWTKRALLHYGSLAECFIKQYSDYYLPDVGLFVTNGNKTLNTNLPDNIAVRTGYYAFKNWKSSKQITDQFVLPFSGEQLYFINYARTMCHNAMPTFTRKFPYLSLHSVARLRVVGPLQNSKEFSSAFQCPVGTRMNPSDKCYFW